MYNKHESIVGLPELLPITSTASSPTSAVAAIGESAGPSRVSQENVHISKKRPVMAILSDDEDVDDPVIHIPNNELCKKITKKLKPKTSQEKILEILEKNHDLAVKNHNILHNMQNQIIEFIDSSTKNHERLLDIERKLKIEEEKLAL